MHKVIKKTIKILVIIAVVLFTIPTAIWLIVQNSKVQTWLVDKATGILENKIGTTVYIEKFDYRPFNRVLLRNVYVEDLRGDTLIAAQTVSANLLRFSNKSKVINLNRVKLEGAVINFSTDSTGVMNFTEFVKLFQSGKEKDPNKEVFEINIRNARISESSFRLHNHNAEQLEYGINFKDLNLGSLNVDLRNLSISGDTITFSIFEMDFIDRSGFSVERFRCEVSFSSKHMHFDKLRVRSMEASINMPYLRMSYSSWEDMGNFIEDVRLSGEFNNSMVSTEFLSYLVPDLQQFNQTVGISGSFRGPVSDFRLRDIELQALDSTILKANLNLTGLPNFANTFIFLDIKELSTNIKDIESIENPKTNNPLVDIPDNYYSLKKLNYSGTFTGFISDFVAFGTLTSGIGNLSIDLSFKPDEKSTTKFDGKVSTRELDLGKLTANPMLGKISLKATVKGSTDYGSQLEAFTDATIFAIEANDYNYTNIELSGNLSNRNFVGSVFLDDPNVKLNFMGKVDFSDTIPVFDFSAFVPKLDLVELNLNKTDSISQASFLLTAKFSGNNLDNTIGEVKVVNCFYKNQNGEIKTSDITINANNTVDSKFIGIKSEFVEGELRGKYNYANIFNSFQNLIYLYIPALSPNNQKPEILETGVENPDFNDYIIRMRVRKTQKLTEVLFPSFRIAENTNVFGIYNPDLQTLTLKIKIPELVLAGNVIKDISIDGQTYDTSFVASITTPSLDIGGTFIRNIAINAVASNNNVASSISWDNRTAIKNQGELKANTLFEHGQFFNRINVEFKPSLFTLNDTIWNVASSLVTIDSTRIFINDFAIQNKLQSLKVNGTITSSPTDNIRVDFKDIDISNANLYTKSLGYDFTGNIDGYAMITDLSNNPLFYADLTVEDLQINRQKVGRIQFTSQWFADDKRLSLNALNTLDNTQAFKAVGDIYPETKALNFKVDIEQVMLTHLEPILAGNVYGLEGYLSGIIDITGTIDKPVLDGMVRINEASGTIDFTKTRYRMSDPIFIENSNIFFRNFRIFDSGNRLATLNGAIRTNFFKDITLDLSLAPNNFQFLNTTERDNEMFYGTVFATGQARLTGTPSNLLTNVSVRTEPRTAIFLPLSSSRDVAEFDFVTFVNRSDEIIIIEDLAINEAKTPSNISLILDLQVTPDAEMQIIIDKQLGDIIRANGSGNLKLEINPNNNVFNMFGQYVIERGDYLFTLQGVINKRFRIGAGSTITWNGDVENAQMDIQAIYGLRTNLLPLKPGTEEEIFKRRLQVDCQINLTGKLMEPIISFDINVPMAETDEELKIVLQEALNTDERVSRQFINLLVINSFASDDPTMSAGVGQGLASTVSEMLSNQLSNWLSQWSNNFDIGINYRPGDEISSQEIELALSTQLFNERVTINSNVDMANQNTSTPIAGDFSIDVKIVPSGKLRAKAFARSNNDILYGGSGQSDYTTGAGLMYREDFNNFGELWERYRRIFRRKKEEEPAWPYNNGWDNGKTGVEPDSTKSEKNAFVQIK